MISNCGGDENGRATGGRAGDQTGREWNIIGWYSSPWKCVLRHPREDVRELLAELATKAANNNNIGYDQSQRMTYWEALKKVQYNPAAIAEPVETDCSAGVIANTKAVGYLLKIDTLQSITATYTGNMRAAFKAAGFEVLTDDKYLTSDKYLKRGDILLNDVTHTATNLTDGSYSETPNTSPKPETKRDWLQRGDTGQRVKNAQALLYAHGYFTDAEKDVDGEFGDRTYIATIKFQTDHGLEADGQIGPITLAALNS